jgi:hypothetical protein
MFLAAVATKVSSTAEVSPLVKAVKDGLGVPESSLIFVMSPSSVRDDLRMGASREISLPVTPSSAFFLSQVQKPIRHGVEETGDIFATDVSCLDIALWKIGGAAISLRLVQIANVGTDHAI